MRVSVAYFGGFLVGTAIAYKAPPGFVGSNLIFFLGLVIFMFAAFVPKKERE